MVDPAENQMMIDRRGVVELMIALAALVSSTFYSYSQLLVGREQGRQISEEAQRQAAEAVQVAAREAQMDSVTIIETVSRYVSVMSGYATTATGREQYAVVAGKIEPLTGKITGELGGQLEINQPVVSTLISLAKAVRESLQDPEKSKKRISDTIAEPLKAFASSIDRTIVGGSLAALAVMQSEDLIDKSPISEFKNAELHFISLKDIDLVEFELFGAHFEYTNLGNVELSSCKLASASQQAVFDNSKLVEVRISQCKADPATRAISFRNTTLGRAGQAGIQILPGTTFKADLAGAHASTPDAISIECTDATLHLESLEGARLTNSTFSNCTVDGLIVPKSASLAQSSIKGGRYLNAKFVADSLVGATITGANFSGSLFVLSGIDIKNNLGTSSAPVNISNAVFDESLMPEIKRLATEMPPRVIIDVGAKVWFVSPLGVLSGFVEGVEGVAGSTTYRGNNTSGAVDEAKAEYCTNDEMRCTEDWYKPL